MYADSISNSDATRYIITTPVLEIIENAEEMLIKTKNSTYALIDIKLASIEGGNL